MLKFELDTLDGVDESLAGLYEQKGDKFRLKVEGIDPADELKEALRKEREDRKAAKERADALEREARERQDDDARKRGDSEALEKSWQEKLTKRETEYEEKLKERDSRLQDLTVGAAAREIAGIALKGSEAVIARLAKDRLRYEDGKVVVLDSEGKKSALTPDELREEMKRDPALAPLIEGSKASGGGAGGAKGGGAAKSWNELSGMERVELRRNNPAEHERLKRAAGK